MYAKSCSGKGSKSSMSKAAAMPGIARPLLEQLKPDGRLVAPVGEDDLQSLVRISRRNKAWREDYFGECRFVKMTGRHGFKAQ